MRIAKKHSHLNGEEWLLVHETDAYREVLNVIRAIDAEEQRTKISREKRMEGKSLFSPVALNADFSKRLRTLGWTESRYSYYVASSREQLEAIMHLPLDQQRQYLLEQGEEPIYFHAGGLKPSPLGEQL